MNKYNIGDIIGLKSDIEGKLPDGSAPVYIVANTYKSFPNLTDVIKVFPYNGMLHEFTEIEDVVSTVSTKDIIKIYDTNSEESHITIAFYIPPHFHPYFTKAIKEETKDKLNDMLDALNGVGLNDVSFIDSEGNVVGSAESVSFDIDYVDDMDSEPIKPVRNKNNEDIIKYSSLQTIDECLDALNDLDILHKMFKGKMYLNNRNKVLERLKMLVEKKGVAK